MTSSDLLLQLLVQAYQQKRLDRSITSEMLPDLAEALRPYVAQYEAKHNSLPDQKSFLAMVENFNQDGPLVLILIDTKSPESMALWDRLRIKFLAKTQRDWSAVDPYDQEEIVNKTIIRIQKNLRKFLFLSRFSTWAYKIWQHECWRLGRKNRDYTKGGKFLITEISLDKVDDEGRTLGEVLPSAEPDPQEAVEYKQAIAAFWQRLVKLETTLNIKIFQIYIAGHTLEEVKQRLGMDAPSIATIKRRKDKVLKHLKEDEEIRRIAEQLGYSLSDNEP